MGTITSEAKYLYDYEEVRPNVYQQVAHRNGKINVHDQTQIIRKNERGGYLHLSQNPVIREKQQHDIQLVNSGTLKHNSWISHDSILTGDFKLPLNSLIQHSKVNVKSNHAILIDDSVLDHVQIKIAPNTSASIVSSNLKHSQLDSGLTDNDQVLFISRSNLNQVHCQLQDSSQMIVNSDIHNAVLKDNCDIDTSYLATDERAKLTNMSAHTSDIELHKATLIASDSDIDQQIFRDENAVNNYLVIKDNCIRGEAPEKTGHVQQTTDLDL